MLINYTRGPGHKILAFRRGGISQPGLHPLIVRETSEDVPLSQRRERLQPPVLHPPAVSPAFD